MTSFPKHKCAFLLFRTWKKCNRQVRYEFEHTVSYVETCVCTVLGYSNHLQTHCFCNSFSNKVLCLFLKGKNFYEKRQKVKNGLCKYIFPDIVVAQKSTPGVSQIIKMVRDFDVPISVTSDGHRRYNIKYFLVLDSNERSRDWWT